VLDRADDISRFREVVTPDSERERWFAARVQAPLIIVPHANKAAYLDHYAQLDQRFADRSDRWWPAPYWDIDTGFASLLILLTAIDEGLGACFFALPKERIDAFRRAFEVPDQFRPIGAISIGYPAEPESEFISGRRPMTEVVHTGRWRVTS
jgi:nitroreductase